MGQKKSIRTFSNDDEYSDSSAVHCVIINDDPDNMESSLLRVAV